MYIRHQAIATVHDLDPAFAAAFDAVFLAVGMDAGLVFVLGA